MSLIIKKIETDKIANNKTVVKAYVLDEEKYIDERYGFRKHNYVRNEEGLDVLEWTIESDKQHNINPITAESVVAICLPKAIYLNQNIVSEIPVDPVFLANIKFIIKRLVTIPPDLHPLWEYHVKEAKSKFHEITVTAPEAPFVPYYAKDRVGFFFSGGFDAAHTALSIKELTDAIHIVGNPANFPMTDINVELLRKIRPDVQLHKVTAPLYDFTEWFYLSHGCFLGSVGLLFDNMLTSVFVNGTEALPNTDSGSGSPIDHMFSNSKMRFFSYGHGWKVDKYKFIKNNLHKNTVLSLGQCCPVPQHYNPKRNKASNNCSKCAECILNMLDIYSLDMEFDAPTFDWRFLNSWLHDKVKTEPKHHPHFYQVLPMKAAMIRKKNVAIADRLILIYNRFVEKLLLDHPDLSEKGLKTI